MMRFVFLATFMGLATGLCADSADEAMRKANFKFAIADYTQQLKSASSETKGRILARLAVAYYKDQDQERAFKTFLEAMDCARKEPSGLLNEFERGDYEKALSIYTDIKLKPDESARLIDEQFTSLYSAQPNNYQLGYVIALAKANLGRFEDFFSVFYRAYEQDPEHYLAHKTKGILHLKLFEKARTEGEKKQERALIYSNIKKAISKNPYDASLYKLAISFSSDEEKSAMVDNSIQALINLNVMVARLDIPFYVQNAVDSGKIPLAKAFIQKAREWYPVSRVLDAAQDYLNQVEEG